MNDLFETPAPESGVRGTGRSLIKKIAQIMGELGQLERTGEKKGRTSGGADFEYDVFTEGDIIAPVQAACARHRIALIPSAVALDRRDIVVDASAKQTMKHLVDVMVEYVIEDAETGEQRTGRAPGSAEERGDGTAVSKALTDANKNFVRKLFQLTAKPDPKPAQRRPVDRGVAEKEKRTAAPLVQGEWTRTLSHIHEVTEATGKNGAKFLWVKISTAGKEGIESLICDQAAIFDALRSAQGKDAYIQILRKPDAKYPRVTGIHGNQ